MMSVQSHPRWFVTTVDTAAGLWKHAPQSKQSGKGEKGKQLDIKEQRSLTRIRLVHTMQTRHGHRHPEESRCYSNVCTATRVPDKCSSTATLGALKNLGCRL